MKRLLVKLIEIYQTYLSFDRGILTIFAPGGACKYHPTCSEYTKEKIREFGVFQGGWQALKRILSCK